ncbi:selenium-dependent molybdenum cofactor biosynthesis protein YqeB [Austwickia chelonae]|uniref:selenium-dependent molybdenum cofactor biosynthesis protein YqeB n=1 Tax=Austwickia chelonae TaxID=100225 RepID=UPI000E24E134|nr:selenium-dependent molybdenum cofactor biosynthesis protein YqeB [Austwickia chelonae]
MTADSAGAPKARAFNDSSESRSGLLGSTSLVVVRGAGDIATGVVQRCVHAGFDVIALELAQPMAVRWRASLCTAVREGSWQVEDLRGLRADDLGEARQILAKSRQCARTDSYWVPVIVDPEAELIDQVRPAAVIDAMLAKRNIGTRRGMGIVTVGCGPGFVAGDDVDYVVESMRGHNLGRVLSTGKALPNTGVPGVIAGHGVDRVVRAPASGRIRVVRDIADVVDRGETLCILDGVDGSHEVLSPLSGVVRGMIPDGAAVPRGLKIADVDPRPEMVSCCDTISDKARAVGGGALDAVLQGLSIHGQQIFEESPAFPSGVR